MAQPTGVRAEMLARDLRRAVDGWILELEALTAEQWEMTGRNAPEITLGEDENRLIGQIVDHIAIGLALHRETVRQIVAGLPTWMPTLDVEGLAELNAGNAAANPHPDKDATVQLVREKGADLAEAVAGLTGNELDRRGSVYGMDLSVEQFIHRIAIGHGNWHLSSIRATIEPPPGG